MNQYFEQMILSASPVELIRLLYQRAISSVRDAREHLKKGRIMERGQAINKAFLVLVELNTSLSAEDAPELAGNLSGLYSYMQKRLLEANLKQKDEPLAEVLCLLTTLEEAWKAIPDRGSEPEAAPAPRRNPWTAANTALMEDEPVRLALSA